MADPNYKYEPPSGPPPSMPPQVHHDAGPYYPPDAPMGDPRGPIPNSYPPAQGPTGYYGPPQAGWNQGPPGPWPPQPGQGPQPYGHYGPPQPGMYYQQGPPVGYIDDRRGGGGAGGGFYHDIVKPPTLTMTDEDANAQRGCLGYVLSRYLKPKTKGSHRNNESASPTALASVIAGGQISQQDTFPSGRAQTAAIIIQLTPDSTFHVTQPTPTRTRTQPNIIEAVEKGMDFFYLYLNLNSNSNSNSGSTSTSTSTCRSRPRSICAAATRELPLPILGVVPGVLGAELWIWLLDTYRQRQAAPEG
ncbi:uncharacterized protein A1O9_02130 [Exophiala aquamarina CBS 119918]|uniref:Uncharacterized protein n=1 Tax=Exophiala aquamarina CBS 119918 TaxID=1182545 RepID=A0A072PKC2_9EURO|nr:uncharacterized protein A1O9_02130 [Exophiala aquamarina CBS 119918]KEF60569.1 hypothetical protein A1O9_02130 [Exophiala aquamarina CBS 119918]